MRVHVTNDCPRIRSSSSPGSEAELTLWKVTQGPFSPEKDDRRVPGTPVAPKIEAIENINDVLARGLREPALRDTRTDCA